MNGIRMKIVMLQFSLMLWLTVGSPASAAQLTSHPRLMSSAWLSALSTWSNDSTWGPWQRFQTFANTNFGDSNDAARLFAKTLMWKMGKGNSYLTDVLSNFDSIVNGIGTSDAVASKAIYVAYAYDLLYGQLPVTSQKNAVNKFISWQDLAKADPWVKDRYVFQNYGIEKWAPALIVAAAGAYDPADVANGLDIEYTSWKTDYFNPALYWANQVFHGAMQEGTYYGTVKDSNYFLHAADAIYMAEGIDLFNQNDWFSKRLTWEWQIYSIPYKFTDPIGGPGEYGWYYHAWGHSERLRATVPFQARLNIQLLLSRVTNNPYRGEIYSYLYGNDDSDLNKPVYDFYGGGALWAFLYGGKDLASQAVPQSLQFWTTNVNTAYGPGYAFLRTGYTADDIYISFKCGDMLSRGHDNLEEGTFQLWAKGEDLAIHSGAYDGSGEFSQTSDYFSRTVSMNGIIVRDPNEQFWLTGSARDNDGGQRSYTDYPQEYKSTGSDETSALNDWLTNSKQPGGTSNPPGVNQKGRHLKADHLDNEYSYVFCDLARAYNSDQYVEGSVNTSKLSTLTRELVLIGNRYLVVMDKIAKKNTSYQDKWLLHTQTSFNVNGTQSIPSEGEQSYSNSDGSFSTTVNSAKLYGQVVFPSKNFLFRRFNGVKKYWNYVKNVSYGSNQGNWYSIQWGGDRIEIEPADNNLSHNFLVVLYPTYTTTTSMPPAAQVSVNSNNMIGTHIKDSSLNYISLFSADSTGSVPAGDINYTVKPTTTSRHLLFNLIPNATYYVTVTKDSPNVGDQTILVSTTGVGNFYVASGQGVLGFDVLSNGSLDQTPPSKPTGLKAQ